MNEKEQARFSRFCDLRSYRQKLRLSPKPNSRKLESPALDFSS